MSVFVPLVLLICKLVLGPTPVTTDAVLFAVVRSLPTPPENVGLPDTVTVLVAVVRVARLLVPICVMVIVHKAPGGAAENRPVTCN